MHLGEKINDVMSFVNDQDLFYDTTHLNHSGAIVFSEILGDSIYSLINSN